MLKTCMVKVFPAFSSPKGSVCIFIKNLNPKVICVVGGDENKTKGDKKRESGGRLCNIFYHFPLSWPREPVIDMSVVQRNPTSLLTTNLKPRVVYPVAVILRKRLVFVQSDYLH